MNNEMLTAIYGGPGSGKTNCLIKHVLDSISHPDDISEYGMVTFTRAGAREARQRVQQKLGLDDDTTLPFFRTVHSICYGLLGLREEMVANASERVLFARSKNMDITVDRNKPVAEMDTYVFEPAFMTDGDILFGIYDWCSARDLNPVDDFGICPVLKYARSRFTESVVREFIEGWEEFKAGAWTEYRSARRDYSGRLYDFHDMLRLTLATGRAPPVKKWHWDEFQDNYPLIYKIYRMWTSKPWVESVVIAGDPNQTIYTFAGANPQFFLNELNAAGRTIPLTESHRCAEKIMVFANMLLEGIPEEQRVKWEMHTNRKGGIVDDLDFTEIAETARAYAMAGDTVYILCRTNLQAFEVERLLSMSGVPNTWLKQEEYNGGSAWTRSVPEFIEAVRIFLSEDYIGVGYLKDLLGPMPAGRDRGDNGPGDPIIKWGSKEKLIAGKFATGGAMKTDALMDHLWPSTKMDVIKRLLYVLQEPSANNPYLGIALRKAMTDVNRGGWGGFNLPFRAQQISVGTMHSSKGKECDVAIAVTKMPRPASDAILHDPGAMWDEVRVNYVAATRARNALYIVYPDNVGIVWKSLSHIKSIQGVGDKWRYTT